jgi:hypothetical protein
MDEEIAAAEVGGAVDGEVRPAMPLAVAGTAQRWTQQRPDQGLALDAGRVSSSSCSRCSRPCDEPRDDRRGRRQGC